MLTAQYRTFKKLLVEPAERSKDGGAGPTADSSVKVNEAMFTRQLARLIEVVGNALG